MRQHKYEYDAFISHAVEDKIPIANELCAKLERAGLRIWYSGKELGVGDSIEKTIERGLNRSRYGIVIFSPTYLNKNWTIREFYTLLAKEIEEHKVILPVLYNITLDELKNKDLVMADRFAVNADKGIDFVVDRLVREIKKTPVVKKQEAWYSRIWLLLAFSLLANVALLLKGGLLSGGLLSPTAQPEPVRPVTAGLLIGGESESDMLAQMQAMVRELGRCDCKSRSDAQKPTFAQANYRSTDAGPEEDDNQVQLVAHHGQGEPGNDGRKMTMAVVFQIHTSAAADARPYAKAVEIGGSTWHDGSAGSSTEDAIALTPPYAGCSNLANLAE